MSKNKEEKMSTQEIVDVSICEDNECTSATCHTEIARLKREIYNSEKRIHDEKIKYHELLVLNLKKDIRINQLENNLQRYDKFRGVISDNGIGVLNSVDNSKTKDSVFVRAALKDLYQGDMQKLKQRTFSGQKRSNAKISKDQITPQKKKVLEKLFRERLANVESKESETRYNTLAKHCKSAIEMLNK